MNPTGKQPGVVDMNGDYLDDMGDPRHQLRVSIFFQQPGGGFAQQTLTLPAGGSSRQLEHDRR